MNPLSNVFSLLQLDAADDKEQIATVAVVDNRENSKQRGKGKKTGGSSGETTPSKNENGGPQNIGIASGDFKLPLVWIDLEMTGRISVSSF
ncbi:unnamed protein product [Ilex paraguariensis]|uniref:Uncharacterized protein n=1 Tax=Ilex paraguariensis TaxID=185542 RepID=A0ABC8QQW6_9AQUA